jgi:hypothetical protein
MAFSSLNTFSASTGLGITNKTKYTSGLYYKGYTNNTGTYIYGVVNSVNRYENALLFFSDTNTTKILYSQGTTTKITSTELINYVGVASTTNGISAAATFYGYFKPNATENWSFILYPASGNSNDDISTLWIGSAGQTIENLKTNASLSAYNSSTNPNGYRVRNTYQSSVASVSVTISLTQNLYYPILMNWGQTTGGQVLGLAFKNSTGSYSTNGSGYYYNTGA